MLAIGAALFLMSTAVFPVSHAHADEWCWDDPVVSIGGKIVSINVGVHGTAAEVQAGVRSATVEITVPEDVRTSIVSTTNTHFKEVVVFRHSEKHDDDNAGTEVSVSVKFDSTKNMAAADAITYPGGTTGTTGFTRGAPLKSSFILH
jgi:hypothetical protein